MGLWDKLKGGPNSASTVDAAATSETEGMEIVEFGSLVVGDRIIGSDGNPTEVTAVYDEFLPDTMFLLEFDDGSSIEASGNHLWYIETTLDRQLHRQRVKKARRMLRDLTEDSLVDLEDIATMEQPAEITLDDMLGILLATTGDTVDIALRVAESLGPIIEEITTAVDIETGEEIEGETVRVYDARKFCQQLLALREREWEKIYPVIVGRIVTTEQLTMLGVDVSVPEIRPLGAPQQKR